MIESEPLQLCNRTYIRHRGRVLSFFGGCDYFRLSSHPQVLAALTQGVRKYGLNVAASRLTTGNHFLYPAVEKALANFFRAEAALLVPTGYVTNLVAAQALAGNFSHALIDEKAHISLVDATTILNCPVVRFRHCDVRDFEAALARCGRGSRPVVLTDGMYSRDGSVAPIRAYLKMLPRDGLILVDDAHGAGILGDSGGGAVELEKVDRSRVVQCLTLSKAFGVYGGAVLGSNKLRQQILERSHMFFGATPLPLPLTQAVLKSVQILNQDRSLRRRLLANSEFVKNSLREAGMDLPQHPGPIVPFPIAAIRRARLQRALLQARIFPTFIRYPGGPKEGYFRFVISSEHTRKQLTQLVAVLRQFVH